MNPGLWARTPLPQWAVCHFYNPCIVYECYSIIYDFNLTNFIVLRQNGRRFEAWKEEPSEILEQDLTEKGINSDSWKWVSGTDITKRCWPQRDWKIVIEKIYIVQKRESRFLFIRNLILVDFQRETMSTFCGSSIRIRTSQPWKSPIVSQIRSSPNVKLLFSKAFVVSLFEIHSVTSIYNSTVLTLEQFSAGLRRIRCT